MNLAGELLFPATYLGGSLLVVASVVLAGKRDV